MIYISAIIQILFSHNSTFLQLTWSQRSDLNVYYSACKVDQVGYICKMDFWTYKVICSQINFKTCVNNQYQRNTFIFKVLIIYHHQVLWIGGSNKKEPRFQRPQMHIKKKILFVINNKKISVRSLFGKIELKVSDIKIIKFVKWKYLI